MLRPALGSAASSVIKIIIAPHDEVRQAKFFARVCFTFGATK